jgi:hypothetical protein
LCAIEQLLDILIALFVSKLPVPRDDSDQDGATSDTFPETRKLCRQMPSQSKLCRRFWTFAASGATLSARFEIVAIMAVLN